MNKTTIKAFFSMNLYQWVAVVAIAGTLFWGIASYAFQVNNNTGEIVTIKDTLNEMGDDVASIEGKIDAIYEYFLGDDSQ